MMLFDTSFCVIIGSGNFAEGFDPNKVYEIELDVWPHNSWQTY
jgi:hypothetical protein